MIFKRPGLDSGLPRKMNRLNIALAALALLCYLLFLTGDYFLPVKSPLWLGAALLVLAGGTVYKIARSRGVSLAEVRHWLAANWPALVLVVALLGGGLLRYQALKNRPNTPASPAATTGPAGVQAFANDARNIINSSDWQPKSYEQPPLYLFGGAVITELIFFQQASAGKINSPEQVNSQDILDYLNYVNLILGLVTVAVVYAAARRWWKSRTAGAIAAGLTGMAWLAYQATPNPAPQLLAAALAALSFYFMTFIEGKLRWPLFGAGLLAGLATGAAYGAVLILVPLLWLAATRVEKGHRWKWVGLGLGGWLLGWTLACPGWILSLNRFVAGLSAIKAAPAAALNSYFQQFFSYDLGLLAVVFLTVAFAFIRRTARVNIWPLLAFPLLYSLVLNFAGPVNVTRLALVAPWLALAAAGPLAELAGWLQDHLPGRFRKTTLAGATLTLGILAVVLLVSILGRRFFA